MRVAIVGLGEAGSDIHMPALTGMRGVDVVGACDRDGSRRTRAQERWGVPCFDDLGALLDTTRPDLVVIATPPESHADLCVRSLETGCHVVCEKPFVTTLDEAERVIATAQRTGRTVAVNHEFKEMPIFRAVLDGARAPEEGGVRFAQVWQLMNRPPWEEAGWRGGLRHRTLYEAGVHLVDFLLALFGELPTTVSASVSSAGDAGEQDAVVLATFGFPSGGLAHLLQSRVAPGAAKYFEARVDTARSSFRASYGGRARLSLGLYHSGRPHVRAEFGLSGTAWREVGAKRTQIARNPSGALVHATRVVFQRAFDAIAGSGTVPVSAPQARDVLAVIGACYLAASEGRTVRLESDPLVGLRRLALGAPAARA